MSNLLFEANATNIDKLFQIATGVARDVAAGKTGTDTNKPYSYSSIAKAASKLIAVFPVLMSTTVSPETAQMVSKYTEQVDCQFITLALQQANIDTAKSGIEYLRKFHQNLDIGGNGVDAITGAMDAWIDAYNKSKGIHENSISANMINEGGEQDLELDELLESDYDLKISSRDMTELMQVMKEMDNIQFYDTKLNPISINDFTVRESSSGDYHVSIKPYVLNEAKNKFDPDKNPDGLYGEYWEEYLRRRETEGTVTSGPGKGAKISDARERIYNEILARQRRDESSNNRKEHEEDRTYNKYKRDRDDKEHEEDRTYNKYKRDRDDKEHEEDRAYNKAERKRQEKERRDEEHSKYSSGRNVSILRDQDIKKMNDALPSMLVVKFYHQENGTVSGVATEFIVGVKAKLIPVTTTEVLRRIMNDNKDGKKFINFMRMITGELKASELIFGLSRITDDVKSCKVKGAYGDTWNLLANRAKAARDQVKRGQRNDFSAITTLCISQYDADELYREENFDISNPKNAYHFMQSYNLMAFAIVDDATESLKILFDNGSKQFDEISYRMLERETQDGTYKKLINLMAASK